jgi:RNA polymerase sporulation-specific sigma factor
VQCLNFEQILLKGSNFKNYDIYKYVMKEYLLQKRLKQLTQNNHLTDESNELLFKEYRDDLLNNIPKEESEARTLLLMGNRSLIYFVLNRSFSLFTDYDILDETAVGNVGLVKAVDTYNVDMGVKFITYAYRVIFNEINMYYKKINSKSNFGERTKMSLDDYVNTNVQDGEELTLADMISDPYDFVEDVQEFEIFEKVVDKIKYLSKQEAVIIINYFGLFGQPALKQQSISSLLGVSRSNVSRHFSSAVKKLKALSLNEDDLTDEERNLKYELIKNGPDKETKTYFKR